MNLDQKVIVGVVFVVAVFLLYAGWRIEEEDAIQAMACAERGGQLIKARSPMYACVPMLPTNQNQSQEKP